MKNVILGLNLFGHDSSTAIVDESNGEILFALSEERLSGEKHSMNFPIGSMLEAKEIIDSKKYLLKNIAINVQPENFITQTLYFELQRILGVEKSKELKVFLLKLLNFNEFLDYNSGFIKETISKKLQNLELTILQYQEAFARIFCYFNWAVNKLIQSRNVNQIFPNIEYKFFSHHECHAFSSFINSGFNEATIVTFDGQGESESHTTSFVSQGVLQKISNTIWPNSLGLFVWLVRNHLGLQECDEAKVMTLATYGRPKYYDFLKQMIEVENNPSICLKGNKFFQRQEVVGINGHFFYNFTEEFSNIVPPKTKKWMQEHFDLACSTQLLVEDIVLDTIQKSIDKTNERKICLAGNLFQNSYLNSKIINSKIAENLFIFPQCTDDGGAVGAAQYNAFLNKKFNSIKLKNVFFGKEYFKDDLNFIYNHPNLKVEKTNSIQYEIAKLISNQKIVARFTFRSEFSQRALGNRSIFADPRNILLKKKLTEEVKFSDELKVFGCSIMSDHVLDYTDFQYESNFMEYVVQINKNKTSEITAILHHNDTTRLHSVDKEDNPDLYKIINEFYKISNIPILLNTSFNYSGFPIVETPKDAIDIFLNSSIDFLAIDNLLISKSKINLNESIENINTKRKLRYKNLFDNPLNNYKIHNFDFANMRIVYNYENRDNSNTFTKLFSFSKSFLKLKFKK